MPSPIFTKKLKESLPTEEGEESEEERDIEMEPTSEEKGTKQEQEGSIQEDFPRYSEEEEKEDSEKLDESKEIQLNEKKILKNEEEEDKDLLWFEKSLVTLLFDYKRWNRPLRYIKNDRFENAKVTKKVPRWSYKLTDEFEEEEQEEENEEETTEDPEIRSRKAKRVVYCLLLRLINPNEIAISSIERGEICLDVMLIDKELTVRELITKGIFIIEPVRLSLKRDGQFLMYQTLSISLAHKSKHKTNPRFRKGKYVDEINPNFDGSIAQDRKTLGNRDENHYDFFFLPENILSPVRRRELRILMDFNCGNGNVVDRNTVLCNGINIKNCVQFLDENKYLDIDTNK
ncbi:hypothetical protein H6P81_000022 [Aristolochia fimbriata]|uniref:Uncharacterized protein n=1 Tax=Aristolochia fimbriata TaxID=158543 RepID=A0AAV7F4C5_ARIFI|nr:hypothetical protein H6P81_000022 [Aristolochia fimbriata]